MATHPLIKGQLATRLTHIETQLQKIDTAKADKFAKRTHVSKTGHPHEYPWRRHSYRAGDCYRNA